MLGKMDCFAPLALMGRDRAPNKPNARSMRLKTKNGGHYPAALKPIITEWTYSIPISSMPGNCASGSAATPTSVATSAARRRLL